MGKRREGREAAVQLLFHWDMNVRQPLAEVELLIAQRGLRLEPHGIEWRTHLVLRGLAALPVSFD
jgi:transcription termination factor NusB